MFRFLRRSWNIFLGLIVITAGIVLAIAAIFGGFIDGGIIAVIAFFLIAGVVAIAWGGKNG